jgi:SAM-dependent methyltransferase
VIGLAGLAVSIDDRFVPCFNAWMFKRRRRERQAFQALQRQIAEAEAYDLATPHDEPWPFPPARLRYRVHGDVERHSFARWGRQLSADLQRLVSDAGSADAARVLDFGCGCGRVLRYVRDWLPAANLHGADIDREAIDWCRAHFDFARFSVNEPRAPMEFPEGHCDLIYGVSVFTHIDEAMQYFWLAELNRVVRPGGLLVLSVHGAAVYQDELHGTMLDRLRRDGFLFKVGTTGRFKLDGLPDFYQIAFHTRDYIERVWSQAFAIVAYVPRGIAGRQDAVVLMK